MKTVHLICNAHLDPVWQWEWEEGAATAISTFRTATELAEQNDGFIFNHNEALLYRWVEEYEPELFARIQKLVSQDQWHIMGGWYLQPDCNMLSGESFIRQILLGYSYFQEKFGVYPTTAINFDPFGHSRGLVQILKKSGFDSYIVCRPDPGNCPLPAETFWWEGFDGSRVLVSRGWGGYLSALGKAKQKVNDYLETHLDETISLILWGVGDHGGGPSRQDVQDINELISSQKEDIIIRHSTPETFFKDFLAQENEIPVYKHDLNPWGVGCYTSQTRLKHKHRLLENELFIAEKMASAAWILNQMKYPFEELHEAMRDLAFSQFHDILPGSSIQPVEEMGLRLIDHGLEIISRIKGRVFFALAKGQIKAKNDEIPILVYNPHPYPVDMIIECEFQLADQNWDDTFTTATAFPEGCSLPLPTQIEQESGNVNLDWRKRVVFPARLLPSQMNRFDCRLERISGRSKLPELHPGDPFIFKNERMQFAINLQTGLVDRYLVDGIDILKSNACQAQVITDTPDPWGMTVRSFRDLEGVFSLLSPEESSNFAGVPGKTINPVRIIEAGPVRTVVEALFGYNNSRLCLRYKLAESSTQVEIEVIVHWNEKDRMLKLSFPTAFSDAKLLGQVAYGRSELKNNGEELVAQKWALVQGENTAFSVINDRTYGLDYISGELRLSLLRSSAYAAHPIKDRPIVPANRYSLRIDQGERHFHFYIQGGEIDDRLEKVEREALSINEKPMTLSFFPEGRILPGEPFVTTSDPAIIISTIKKAEDGNDLILRLFEPTGRNRSSEISLPFLDLTVNVNLMAFEIVTLRVNLDTRNWIITDLLERVKV